MKYLRKIKSFSVIIVLIMVLQLVLPTSFTGAEPIAEQEQNFIDFDIVTASAAITADVNIDVVTKITATKNGINLANIANYRPVMGDEVTLRFEFTLPSNHNYGDGSKLTYPLPTPLKPASGSGDLSEGGEIYATYEVDKDNVIIIFNDNIRFQGAEGSGGLETTGFFEIQAKFKEDENNTKLEQDLILPGSDTIKLNFQPTGGKVIDKKVDPASGNNINSLKWVVDVNTVMDDLGTTGVEFKDTLTGNHKYNPTSLKVIQLVLGTDGKAITSNDVTNEFAALVANETNFILNLTGKFAYKIEYETIPGDTEEKSQILGNKATFNGRTSSKSSTIQYGDPLTKSVSQNGEQANWTIKVNGNKKTLPIGITITDSWNSDKHELVPGTFKVNGDVVLPLGLTVVHSSQGFLLTLGQAITEEFTITYSTKPKDLVTETINVNNEVYRSDRTWDIKYDTGYYSQNVLSKTNSNINYQNKTVDWKIELNNANYEMDSIVLTDTFFNKNLKIVDGTFKVVKNGIELNNQVDYTITYKDGDVAGDKKGGFILSIPNSTDKITITYTTEYDVRGATNLDKYENTGSLVWKTVGNPYSIGEVKSIVTINNQQKNKGYKDGVYNYQEKKFEWKVGINYNFDKISNPIFTDTLSNSQVVDRNSIKVYKIDLTHGGDGEIIDTNPLKEGIDYTLTPAPLENTFTITFVNEINEPYRIMYESKTKLDYYAPNDTGTDHVISNNATLTDNGNPQSNWTKDVTVEHSDKLITKNYKQIGSSAKLNWTLNLNWSQSTLEKVVITDTVGKDDEGNPNQMVYKDSFKVIEMKFNGNNKDPVEVTIHLPGSGLYDVTFDDHDSTFKITFNETIDKAYIVKYDTYFLGASGDKLENEAKLSYISRESGKSETDAKLLNGSFKYTGGASAVKGQLEITKVDKNDSNKKLSGAIFELWSGQTGGFLIERVSEDVGGVYTFKTKVGQSDYYLKETKAPDGYSLDESEYKVLKKVTIKDNGTPSTSNYVERLTINNTKINQAVELIKVDADNTNIKLKGAEFTLQYPDGTRVTHDKDGNILEESFITNDQGMIFVDNLLPGNYQLIETTAPTGYWLDTTPVDFEVKLNQLETTSKVVTNTKQRDLIIKKVDSANGNPLLGAVFKLYAVNDTTFSSSLYTSLPTDADGNTKFTNVRYGDYILKETTAPTGYVVKPSDDGNKITVNSATQDVIIENEQINQAVKLTKADVDNNTIKLGGAVFTLHHSDGTLVEKDKDGVELPKSFKTDENGEFTVNKLAPGNYYFVEIEAPRYYLQPVGANNKTSVFTITKDQTTFTNVDMTNKRGEGSIIIKKVDAADNSILLEGVEFILTSKFGTITKTSSTNADGKIEFTNLPYDTYTLTESKAHKDYVISALPQEIVLDGKTDGISEEVIVENTKKDHSVKLIKYNGDKTQKLEGAIFELRKEIAGVYEVVTGIDIKDLTTDKNGEINLKDLPVGKYQLIETSAAAGYRLNSDPVEFEILENQTTTTIVEKLNSRKPTGGGGGTPEIPKVPEIIPGTKVANILINKVDEDSNPLEGAEFTLYDENGFAIGTVVSDKNGNALFNNLPFGNYSIKETKAPENYELSQEVKTVNITESTTYSYTFTNVLSETKNGNSGNTENSNSGGSKTEIDKPNGQTTLPNTGSIFNTTLLAIIGLILIVAGIVSIKRNKIRS